MKILAQILNYKKNINHNCFEYIYDSICIKSLEIFCGTI